MGKGDYLGDFEHLVLLAIIRQEQEGYGLAIRDEIVTRTGRDVATGAIYTTLDRLEKKGYVRSSIEQGTVDRDNRRRRRYKVTKKGLDAVNETQASIGRMSAGLNVAWDRK
jgi:PadR family transcriptional regulator, regulatory protein PadR